MLLFLDHFQARLACLLDYIILCWVSGSIFFYNFDCLNISCVANHTLNDFDLVMNNLCSIFTLNPTVNNNFTGSLPSEIGLLTEIAYLAFGKWKYLVDYLDCLSISCFANHILSAVESH